MKRLDGAHGMRKYYIYIQKAKSIYEDENKISYTYEAPQFLTSIEGAKNLYLFFRKKYCITINEDFKRGTVTRFKRPLKSLEKEFGFLCYPLVEEPNKIYQIKNEKNEIINYKEVVKKYQKKKNTYKSKTNYYYSKGSNYSSRRKSLSPAEKRELKDDYNIVFKDFSVIDPWTIEKTNKVQRSWKAQKKKRKRYF